MAWDDWTDGERDVFLPESRPFWRDQFPDVLIAGLPNPHPRRGDLFPAMEAAAMLDAPGGAEPTARFCAPPVTESFYKAIARAPGRLRVAFCREPLLPGQLHPACARAVLDAARLCESLGHEVVERGPAIDRHEFAKAFFHVYTSGMAGEFRFARAMLGRRVRPHDVETSSFLLGQIGDSTPAGALSLALRRLHAEARKVHQLLEEHDVLLTPTLGAPPVKHFALQAAGLGRRLHELVARLRLKPLLRIEALVDMTVERAYEFTPFTMVFNVSGQPSISLPLCWGDDGLPIGVMFTGRYGDDAGVLRLARQLEQARPWADRRPPGP